MKRFIANISVGITTLLCVVPITVLNAGVAQAANPKCTTASEEWWGSNSVGGIVARLPTTDDLSTTCAFKTSTDYSFAAQWLQTALHDCYGQKIDIDGIFGPSTKTALEVVQRKIGVTDDGVYGPTTGKKLEPLLR